MRVDETEIDSPFFSLAGIKRLQYTFFIFLYTTINLMNPIFPFLFSIHIDPNVIL